MCGDMRREGGMGYKAGTLFPAKRRQEGGGMRGDVPVCACEGHVCLCLCLCLCPYAVNKFAAGAAKNAAKQQCC